LNRSIGVLPINSKTERACSAGRAATIPINSDQCYG
jgi:hypothetical protein